jgi:hypothetical protein
MGLPFHPFWLIAVLIFLGVPAALVVLLVSTVHGSRPRRPGAYGLRSPDGQWWWDGFQWQPVAPPESDTR